MKRPTRHPTLVFGLGCDGTGLLIARPDCRCASLRRTCDCLECCPACGTALVVTDDGTGTARVDCTSCEYADTWTVTEPSAGGAR